MQFLTTFKSYCCKALTELLLCFWQVLQLIPPVAFTFTISLVISIFHFSMRSVWCCAAKCSNHFSLLEAYKIFSLYLLLSSITLFLDQLHKFWFCRIKFWLGSLDEYLLRHSSKLPRVFWNVEAFNCCFLRQVTWRRCKCCMKLDLNCKKVYLTGEL